MLDPEREVEMELEGDSNDVSGSPTTRSPSQFMDYEMGMMFSSLSPLDPSFGYSVSPWNSPSPGRRPQSPEFEISLWNFPSPSRWPSPDPGFSRLISSHGNASSSTQPPVRSPSPPFSEQGAVSLDVVLQRLQQQLQQLLSLLLQRQELQQRLSLLLQRQDLISQLHLPQDLISQLHLPQLGKHQREKLLLERLEQLLRGIQQHGIQQQQLLLLGIQQQQLLERLLEQLLCRLQQQQQQLEQLLRDIQQQLLERLQQLLRRLQQRLLLHQLEQHLRRLQQCQLEQQGLGLILLGQDVQQQAFFMVQELARLHSLHNKKRALHKFIQNASQIALQIKIKMAHEICEEGHEDTSIQILDKITVVTKAFKLHLSWTKAPCRHSSQGNASDLKKSCTSFDGCYKHQDCMSTAKLEICVDFNVDDIIISHEAFFSPRQFFCSEFTIESQSFHAICEPIAPADDEPDSRCELTHISHCTRSPPGPNDLPDGEETPQQDSLKHQLMEETHAMNDGENVLSEDGMDGAVSYPENEGTRKTPKRRITLGDLQLFSGSRKDAANHFGVSVPTIKRCLRDHKIKDWRNRNIDKNNQCLSEPKEIIEAFPGEGAEMGNQMAGGSRSCERELNHGQIGSDRSQIGVGLMEECSTRLETTPTGNMFASSAHEQCIEAGDHSELPLQPSKRKRGKYKIQIPLKDLLNFSGSCMDAAKSFGVSESMFKRNLRELGIKDFCDLRKIKNNQCPIDIIESVQGEGAEMGNHMAGGSKSCERELNHEQFGFPPESEKSLDMSQCIQASGELLKDHNISAIVAVNTEQVPESSWTNLSCSIPAPKLPEATAAHMIPLVTETQDTRTVTIKATYEDDMIRFQLSLTSGITELRREVAERLKLEVDSFSIKYLDDDDDLILMTGDKDLHECFKISVSLGRKFIKLSIHKR